MLTEEWMKSRRSNPSGNCVQARWTKSSKSLQGNCVETRWKPSTQSTSGNCAEVRSVGQMEAIQVRDSKNPDAGVLTFTVAEWLAFIGGVKDGEFDLE
jgi:hypothetical protein